jgi:hypothetical protein
VVEQTREGVRIKPQAKSTRSRRAVTLPEIAIEALRQHKAAQAEQHLRLGLGKPTLLFPEAAANPLPQLHVRPGEADQLAAAQAGAEFGRDGVTVRLRRQP